MTADEDSQSPPDDDRSADDASSTTPSSAASDAPADERTVGGADPDGTSAGAAGDDAVNSPGAAVESTVGDDDAPNRPPPVPTNESESFFHRFWHAKGGPLFFLREVLTSAVAVLLVGLILFGISGVWPPMVAVESGSMEPHMHRGDLVFITEPGRYTPDAAYGSTGVVTADIGTEIDYRTFGGPGSVVVYDDPDRGGPPIIHRAEFYVEAGENWHGRADAEYMSADNCDELRHCPAPHDGFITKGDANSRYDQASGIAPPVKPTWVTGIARVRIPYLGWVRLGLADVMQPDPYGPSGDVTVDEAAVVGWTVPDRSVVAAANANETTARRVADGG